MAGVAFFFFEEIDRRRRDCFMYVTAAEAGAVCAVPIALDNHGTAASGAGARQVGVHEGDVPSRALAGTSPTGHSATARCTSELSRAALRMPARLAAGFGLKVALRSERQIAGRRPDSPLSSSLQDVTHTGRWFPRSARVHVARVADSAVAAGRSVHQYGAIVISRTY